MVLLAGEVGPRGLARRLEHLDLAQVALVVAPVAVLLTLAWGRRWVAEDAFINIRIVQETLAGHPLSFNAGERVEAGTSPLWIAVLVVLQVLLGWAVDIAWLAVVSGLALTIFGVAAAMAGAARLARRRGAAGILVPAGVLVLVALPPMWDFATSGLETGLTFAWLGGCFWAVAHLLDTRGPAGVEVGDGRARVVDARRATPGWLCVVVGLGPLIRPDLLVFVAAFGALLLLAARGWRSRARVCAIAAASPVAFEVFRAAYFGSLVPNTALAKEATDADWSAGLAYLGDLARPYLLVVPVAALAVWIGALAGRGAGRVGERAALLTAGLPAVAAVVHAVYVVRVGGDFMHARLLLPALFGACLPVAVLELAPGGARRSVTAVACAVLVAWSAVAVLRLRPAYGGATIHEGIADERAFWNALSGVDHAVTLEDHARFAGVARGELGRELSDRGADVLVLADGTQVPLVPGSGVVLETRTIGLVSVAAGTDVHVVDALGLADAVGGRLVGVDAGRVGHEKEMPTAWVVARYAPGVRPPGVDGGQIAAAELALACPPVAELVDATTGAVTPGRLLANLVGSPGRTRLRIPADPSVARACPAG